METFVTSNGGRVKLHGCKWCALALALAIWNWCLSERERCTFAECRICSNDLLQSLCCKFAANNWNILTLITILLVECILHWFRYIWVGPIVNLFPSGTRMWLCITNWFSNTVCLTDCDTDRTNWIVKLLLQKVILHKTVFTKSGSLFLFRSPWGWQQRGNRTVVGLVTGPLTCSLHFSVVRLTVFSLVLRIVLSFMLMVLIHIVWCVRSSGASYGPVPEPVFPLPSWPTTAKLF